MTLYKFIKLTPNNWPHPDRNIVLDYHDNEYGLDWDFGKGRIVSISIRMNGDVYWSAIIDEEKFNGKADKPDAMPQEIFNIFKKLGYEQS